MTLKGIETSLPVKDIGTVQWPVQNVKDIPIDLLVRDMSYTPDTPMNFLCPQQFVKKTGRKLDGFDERATAGILIFDRFKLTIPYNQ